MKQKFEKDIEYSVNLKGKEPEFLMRIGFDSLDGCLLSIAHRQLSNRGSGLKWDSKTRSWMRIVNGIELPNAYVEENKEDTRIYHESYEKHIKLLRLDKLERGQEFVIVGNGNLGNNPWHVAWQYDKKKKLYCLKDEPFLENVYSCFVVPKQGNPKIMQVGFDRGEELLDENNNQISEEVNWCTYGQQIVRESERVSIEEIIDQFADARHIFDLKDWSDKTEEGNSRMERDLAIMNDIYENYPEKFGEKMLGKLREGFPRAEYYHSTLGIDENGIVFYHSKGKIEEIAKKLIDKGVKDSIILDQGGSVGVYASWVYPNGGYLSASSYFRPNRISIIAFTLK
ncbi:hypothetical protein A3K73_01410 [Candidatus Pacearchaeota archaeon RBG_13_36_9]|nr:MAG: hypothetical protein A3K73_01410 [Candidatus Pacearchaeota archaeon RBG_13_36_9]